ncbi:hypothetical protein TeGR_g1918, partial [Tetraparma gracilis]
IKETAELDADGQDARALGQLLVHEMEPVRAKKRPEQLEAKLHTFVYRTTVLRELADVYPWFERLLLEALRNRLRVPKGSMKALAEFTEEDARKAGRGFANALVANATAEAAVDEWVMTYPALGELEQRYIQTQGLKEKKWRTTLFEMLSVVSFVKPGLDAHRVASGAEQLPGAAVSPLAEMIYTKGGELFFEAIPGLVLQLVALLNADQASNVAIGSILISTASTALTATTLFWDGDTDPGARKRNPDWIGIVPDLNRGSAFAALFLMSALQVIAKAASVALLAVTNESYFVFRIAVPKYRHT